MDYFTKEGEVKKMEEKNVKKISLSTVFLILAIITIIVMGVLIFKLNNDKTAAIQKSTELQSKVNNLNETMNNLQEENTLQQTEEVNNLSEIDTMKVIIKPRMKWTRRATFI